MCTVRPVRLSQSIVRFLCASTAVLAHIVFAATVATEVDEMIATAFKFSFAEVLLVDVEFAGSGEVSISSSAESE